MNSSTKEDIIFYLDLTKDLLKKKDILKAIKFYIDEKNKENIKSRYGVLIFQEEGNPTFITDKKDSDIISKAIEENWKTRSKTTSFFENGLFYILSYISETVRKKSKFNRIIVITDTPSDLNEEYQEALFNLISKVKHFPTFIDVIRIVESDTRFQKDDVKLTILASDTKGGLFYVQDKKEFSSIIKKLIKNKQIATIFTDRPNTFEIDKDDYAFYNNLAKKLKFPELHEEKRCFLCQQDICPICEQVEDTLKKCEDCGVLFHNCCVTDYSIDNNIGIPHIFRCPNCQVLLQIEEASIVDEVPFIQEKDSKEIEVETSIEGSEDKRTVIPETKIVEVSEAKANIKPVQFPPSDHPAKTVRIGGFFGSTFQLSKVGDKIMYQKPQGNVTTDSTQSPKSENEVNYWKPSVSRKEHSIRFCRECGAQIKSNNQKICSKCGIVLD